MASALDKRAMLRLIWQKIDATMFETGMNGETLADKARVSPRIITGIKKAKGNPTLLTLEKIAKALGMPLGKLCDPDHNE